jgi:hypothetical protein
MPKNKKYLKANKLSKKYLKKQITLKQLLIKTTKPCQKN